MKRENLGVLRGFIRETLSEVAVEALSAINKGRGAITVGLTEGREAWEDVQTGLDVDCFQVYVRLRNRIEKELKLRVSFHYEGEGGGSPVKNPDIIMVVDEFGGTKYAKYGFRERAWSVCSFYDPNVFRCLSW